MTTENTLPEQEPVEPVVPVVDETSAVAEPMDPAAEIDADTVRVLPDHPVPFTTPSVSTQMDYPVFEPIGSDEISEFVLSIPAAGMDAEAPYQSRQYGDYMKNNGHDLDWWRLKRMAGWINMRDNVHAQTSEREGSAFRQGVQSERGLLTAAAPSFKDTENVKLTGERAMLRVRSLLNMGTIVQIPLWHSGFWVSLKAPTEAEILELHFRMAQEKTEFGRLTNGLAFSNETVFFTSMMMDFALAHLYDSSLKDTGEVNVRSKIVALDIPILLWGLACVIWPRGFQYARSIIKDDEHKIIREKLNLSKLLWTDTSALTPWQVSHMANRSGNQMTNESVDRYRTEFTRGQARLIELAPGLSMTLKVPTADHYIRSGQSWINSIILMVDSVFGVSDDPKVREEQLFNHGRAANMRQFGHWVESIQLTNGNTIEDEDSIEQTLDVVSSVDEMRDKYRDGIRKYIEDSTVSLVAVPAVGDEEKSELARFPHLLPLDAVATFFTLLIQRVDQIKNRE